MKIIDNLLPESYVAEIEKAFTSPYFPWFSYGGTFAYTQHERELYKNAVFDHRTIDFGMRGIRYRLHRLHRNQAHHRDQEIQDHLDNARCALH